MGTAIQLDKVSKAYRKKSATGFRHMNSGLQIFQDFSLSLQAGRTLAILGPSGCGKSSLLRLCAGLELADKGSVRVFDQAPLALLRTGEISLISSENPLLPWRSAEANVRLPLDLLGTSRQKALQRVEALLMAVRIQRDRRDLKPHELSEGQRQRLRLAQALVTSPSLLLLDEPFSNVDEGLRRVLVEIVTEYLKNADIRSSIIVTHHAYEAVAMAHDLVVIGGEPASIVYSLALENKPGERSYAYIASSVQDVTSRLLSMAHN